MEPHVHIESASLLCVESGFLVRCVSAPLRRHLSIDDVTATKRRNTEFCITVGPVTFRVNK